MTDIKLALAVLKAQRAAYAEYQAAVEDDRRNGYRAHYCRHGVNQWVDYDAICGQCEDGRAMWHYMDEASDALGLVRRREALVRERMDKHVAPLFRDLWDSGDMRQGDELWNAAWTICEWANEPVARLKREVGF